MQKFIYRLTMCRSKGYIQKQYGKSFWKSFREHSDAVFRQVAAELPDIGDSIFPLIMPMRRPMWRGIGLCVSWGWMPGRRTI